MNTDYDSIYLLEKEYLDFINMKKYLFIVLLVGVWSCGDKPVDFSTLIVKDGLVYESDNSKLFDNTL